MKNHIKLYKNHNSCKCAYKREYEYKQNESSLSLHFVFSIEKRKEQMSKVTKEDVMKLAEKVHIDTVYLLKGER